MFNKSRNWISEAIWKPKTVHSLEKLKYLHFILTRNSIVTEGNKSLLVETLRSIAEILIWGDQNDSSVFDFFLEKNMLLFFLKIMTQNCGTYVTVQLLQTLNILFENIRHETSLYFLLSNNHVNSIIVHKFDFSNEEVLAYYISFLKTLSLKLNQHTVNFYFNEQKNDFPLYTEGIKFFNHPESMVRIAVRTLTLNVYRVGHEGMLNFICDKTADPYFSNLVWFIGKHAIELEDCVMRESDHLKCDHLKMHVADHLDHLHYLHDILCLGIERLNIILTDHLLNRLLIPLYVYSLPSDDLDESTKHNRVRISRLVSLFLLAQHLLIMNHEPLISSLVNVILHDEEEAAVQFSATKHSPAVHQKLSNTPRASPGVRAFVPPPDSLESQLEASGIIKDNYNLMQKLQSISKDRRKKNSTFYVTDGDLKRLEANKKQKSELDNFFEEETSSKETNSSLSQSESENENAATNQLDISSQTDICQDGDTGLSMPNATSEKLQNQLKVLNQRMPNGIFVNSIYSAFDCENGDCEALFAISFFYALLKNEGINKKILENAKISLPEVFDEYNDDLMERLISVLEQGSRDGSKVRLITLNMAIIVIKLLAVKDDKSRLKDYHFAMIENVREATTFQLRNFYRADEVFLEMFECEYQQILSKPINVQYVMMDASLLLPPTNTPLTGIEFNKRLPCGEEERARRAIRVFLFLRDLCLLIRREPEIFLPLNKVENPVKEDDVLDLNNSDLIGCTVMTANRQYLRRFLVIDSNQFILVEPDTSKLGWGVVKFVALLQDVEATPDKDDSRSLSITVHRPFAARNRSVVNPLPLLSGKFVFDDYIRCMSARQRLQRRGTTLRHRKMTALANLLELPVMAAPPTHFYSLTPYNASAQAYIWSPSSRRYTSRSDVSLSDVSSSSSETQTVPKAGLQKTLPLSPQHSKILEQQGKGEPFGEKDSETPRADCFNAMSPDQYSKPIKLDTPRPQNEKPQRSQAESLASALGARFGTDEVNAEEENVDDWQERHGRKLTFDEAEEADEELDFNEDNNDEMLYDCKDAHLSTSHANLLDQIRNIDLGNSKGQSSISAPSTPTGARKIGLFSFSHSKTSDDNLTSAKSLPAIALEASKTRKKKKGSTKNNTTQNSSRSSSKSKVTQPYRSTIRSSKKKR